MLDDTKMARKKVKQPMNAFTLRYRMKYSGKLSHLKWLKELSHSESYEKPVSQLRCFKEIDTTLCEVKFENFSTEFNLSSIKS